MIYGANKQFHVNEFKTKALQPLLYAIFISVFAGGKPLKSNLF
jgi:hypothetical protein